ncbi:hypothetical protein [uncultured Aquimonas sp.]|uniref:hypothetical protein n=1 Tax=uncultured Aquimonas sp. TaxID=385483 RepID=UPI00086B5B12|nr:hypothetical protein [uncultured Aquimonas sp.]ODU42073.1 MAG: hypothetical protein ABS96_29045 [Xanthomonadaceae bacterium SCN 69-123]
MGAIELAFFDAQQSQLYADAGRTRLHTPCLLGPGERFVRQASALQRRSAAEQGLHIENAIRGTAVNQRAHLRMQLESTQRFESLGDQRQGIRPRAAGLQNVVMGFAIRAPAQGMHRGLQAHVVVVGLGLKLSAQR